ncbi:hypothetical protein GCM10007420_14710 [Glycocaulis albus]|uniref:Rhodanese domain-containing protein n=1 Tax=Glycocaulis albus TaxID=1382801 RepID=A0ABQ1XPS0_9PROT|nr:hypothetical protein [Glycocaulis albus]GGG99876.1 hypothetical protein GCM10007420_14710 [Glycocaulis albus]
MSEPTIFACDAAPGCRYAAVLGRTSFETTMRNAQRLVDRLAGGDYASLVIDYRGAEPSLAPDQYTAFFKFIVPELSRLDMVAYVYAPGTLMRAAHATRQLSDMGVNARAFGNWEEAAAFIGIDADDPFVQAAP